MNRGLVLRTAREQLPPALIPAHFTRHTGSPPGTSPDITSNSSAIQAQRTFQRVKLFSLLYPSNAYFHPFHSVYEFHTTALTLPNAALLPNIDLNLFSKNKVLTEASHCPASFETLLLHLTAHKFPAGLGLICAVHTNTTSTVVILQKTWTLLRCLQAFTFPLMPGRSSGLDLNTGWDITG